MRRFFAIALLALGCNDPAGGTPIDAPFIGDYHSQQWDAPWPVDAPTAGPDSSPGCVTARDALAQEIGVAPLTAVIRLDYTTRAVLGFQLIPGAYATTTETEARTAAQAATGYGAAGTMLSPADPAGAWVFYEAPGDFGGAAAVSDTTGEAVFGGSIVWNGAGDITFPTSWRPPAEAGSGCMVVGGVPRTAGWDLDTAGPLSAADIDAAIDVVEQTAIAEAMWQVGYVFTGVVIKYPRSVGAFDPSTAEWIVLVDGGWLE